MRPFWEYLEAPWHLEASFKGGPLIYSKGSFKGVRGAISGRCRVDPYKDFMAVSINWGSFKGALGSC